MGCQSPAVFSLHGVNMNDLITDARGAFRITLNSPATLRARTSEKSRGHDPDFPKPFKISRRKNAWFVADLLEYVNKKAGTA